MPLNTADTGRPMGARISRFSLPADFAFFLQQLLSFSRDPAVVPIRELQEGLFSAGEAAPAAGVQKGRTGIDFPTETCTHLSRGSK